MSGDFPVGIDDIDLRRELVAEGWTDRDIAYAVRPADLRKVRYGAYVRAALVAQLDAVGHAVSAHAPCSGRHTRLGAHQPQRVVGARGATVGRGPVGART